MRTDAGDIILKNNDKGMPYLDLRKLEDKAALSLVQTVQGNMKALPSVKWRKHERLARRKECWGTQPTATSWGWYMAA